MPATILVGDVRERLRELPEGSVQCVVTSPPYWGLRDYGNDEQIGLEQTPEQYVDNMVEVFREVRRVLADDGTLWLNLGDSYATGSGGSNTASAKQKSNRGTDIAPRKAYRDGTLKQKDLVGIPWRVAFALQADGWYLRQDIIWSKPNPMPESVRDRCTKAHEYVFLLTKGQKYHYDADALKEPAKYAGDNRGARTDSRRGTNMNSMNGATGEFRNKRSVWSVEDDSAGKQSYELTEEQTEAIYNIISEGVPVLKDDESQHEYMFLLTKQPRYYYDAASIEEPAKWERWGNQTEKKKHTGTAGHLGGKTLDELPIRDKKNKRSVWTITTKPFRGAHFAVMPEALVEPCILAGSAVGDTVLDPFSGSGTAGVVALRHGRNYIGVELNPDYAELSRTRITDDQPLFNTVEVHDVAVS